jgi:hypothetical protein
VLLKLVVYCGADGTVYSDKLHNFWYNKQGEILNTWMLY